MSNDRHKTAKRLFFDYDGSTFYMSRNDVETVYKAYHVPIEIENEWKRELTALRLSQYRETGKFAYLGYLLENNHAELLAAILERKPNGTYINKLVVLEMISSYVLKHVSTIKNIPEESIGFFRKLASELIAGIPKRYSAFNIDNRLAKISEAIGRIESRHKRAH
jgi:hypothetical protein